MRLLLFLYHLQMLKHDGHIVFQDIRRFGFHGQGDDWGNQLAFSLPSVQSMKMKFTVQLIDSTCLENV